MEWLQSSLISSALMRRGGQSRAGGATMSARGQRDTSARKMSVEPSFCQPGRPRIALGAADVNRAPADRLGGCYEAQKELSLSPPEPVVCKGRKTGLIMNNSVEKGPDGMEHLEKFWASERGASTGPRVHFSQLAGALKPAGRKIACDSASDSVSEISSSGDSKQRSRPRNSKVCFADANYEIKADAEAAAGKLRQLSAGKSAGATCEGDEDRQSSDMELCGSSLESSAQKNDEVLASASTPVCFQLHLQRDSVMILTLRLACNHQRSSAMSDSPTSCPNMVGTPLRSESQTPEKLSSPCPSPVSLCCAFLKRVLTRGCTHTGRHLLVRASLKWTQTLPPP